MNLRDVVSGFGLERLAFQAGEIFELAFVFVAGVALCADGQISVVTWFNFASFAFFDIATPDDPIAA